MSGGSETNPNDRKKCRKRPIKSLHDWKVKSLRQILLLIYTKSHRRKNNGFFTPSCWNSPLCFQSVFAFYRRVITYWNSIEFCVIFTDWFDPDFFQGNIAVTRLRWFLSPENNLRSFLLITQNQPGTRYVIFPASVNDRFEGCRKPCIKWCGWIRVL